MTPANASNVGHSATRADQLTDDRADNLSPDSSKGNPLLFFEY